MLNPDQLFSFLVAALVITASPGPDNLMVLGIGISRGRKQGMVFGLGCALGCLSHTILATLGISAIIAASPLAFSTLTLAGGVYLIYLGIQALRSPYQRIVNNPVITEESLLKLFSRGLIANSINPKVILFFLSFLPQFVLQKNGYISWQTAQLGLIFTAQAIVLFSLFGYFSGVIGQWLNQHPAAGLRLDKIAGCIFITLGLRLLFIL